MAKLGQSVLLVYAGVLTAVFALTVWTGFASPQSTSFDELTVQRLNIVEPDGTLRLVLSNHARFPGIIVRGQERPYERPQAGLLFFNDEGTETGGLIFGGRQTAQGAVVDAGGSLTFDRYEGNQEVQLLGVYDNTDRIAGLIVSDSPPQAPSYRRLFVGRGADGTATVALMDAQGKPRLRLQVTADGTPSLALLDAQGRVVNELRPAKSE
ncbi:MAG: hypothetical protein HY710_04685 [Candidatus Latescibacteria bacterium]|nr:hypothetical protein [Candidatus Latescibacterota bacterium]